MKAETKTQIKVVLITIIICSALLAIGFLYVKTLMDYEKRISYLEGEWEGIHNGKEIQDALKEVRDILPELNEHLDWLKALFQNAQ